MVFRGTTYHFPLKIWLPHAYPLEAPNIYVTPRQDMAVRPGQHVGVDGRVYHPYLRDWAKVWDRASLAEFLGYLQHIFGKEPPVVSRAQEMAQERNHQAGPGAPPPPPPKQPAASVAAPSRSASLNSPPPIPPKPGAGVGVAPAPGEEYAETPQALRDVYRDGPPLPPLPHEMARNQRVSSLSSNRYPPASINPSLPYAAPPSGYQHGHQISPPFPQGQHRQHQLYQVTRDNSPVSPISPPQGVSELPANRYAQQVPPPRPTYHGTAQSAHDPTPHYGSHAHQAQVQQQPYAQQHYGQQQQPQQQTQPKHFAPDLLTDPFEVAMPTIAAQQNIPAPPIPPNPEKEQLFEALSSTLVQQARSKIGQSLAFIPPLQAQQQAIQTMQQRLDGEIRQLEHLEQALANNESILHQSIQACDRTINTAMSKKQPPIDEVLVAPTMVANQLWTLCAEEAACREAMYVLQKANDRGRVTGDVFIRQMRALGRECFTKMALSRKIATGMGLIT